MDIVGRPMWDYDPKAATKQPSRSTVKTMVTKNPRSRKKNRGKVCSSRIQLISLTRMIATKEESAKFVNRDLNLSDGLF